MAGNRSNVAPSGLARSPLRLRYQLMQRLAVGPALAIEESPDSLSVVVDLQGWGTDVEVLCSPSVLTVRAAGPTGFCHKVGLPEGALTARARASLGGGKLSVEVPLRASRRSAAAVAA